MPALGIGLGVVDYSSGACDIHPKGDCHDVRHIGLGMQMTLTFVYAWRFGSVTCEPLRADAFLFERQTAIVSGYGTEPGGSYGVSRNGVELSSSLGFSLNLSAMVLSIRDSIVGVTKQVIGP